MTDELSKEERILRVMKKVLTDVAKDTYTPPGLKHPLSEATIINIRDCLGLIAAREAELANAAGRSMNQRPRFADEPAETTVISLDLITKRKKDGETH